MKGREAPFGSVRKRKPEFKILRGNRKICQTVCAFQVIESYGLGRSCNFFCHRNIERTVSHSEETDDVQTFLEIRGIRMELMEVIIGRPQYGAEFGPFKCAKMA